MWGLKCEKQLTGNNIIKKKCFLKLFDINSCSFVHSELNKSEYLVHTISVQCLLLDRTTLDCVVRSTAMRRTPPNASEHRRNSTGCL